MRLVSWSTRHTKRGSSKFYYRCWSVILFFRHHDGQRICRALILTSLNPSSTVLISEGELWSYLPDTVCFLVKWIRLLLLVDYVAGRVTTGGDVCSSHILLSHHALHLSRLVRNNHRLLAWNGLTCHGLARHGMTEKLRVGALTSSLHPLHALHLMMLLWISKAIHDVGVVSAGTVDTRTGWHSSNHRHTRVKRRSLLTEPIHGCPHSWSKHGHLVVRVVESLTHHGGLHISAIGQGKLAHTLWNLLHILVSGSVVVVTVH